MPRIGVISGATIMAPMTVAVESATDRPRRCRREDQEHQNRVDERLVTGGWMKTEVRMRSMSSAVSSSGWPQHSRSSGWILVIVADLTGGSEETRRGRGVGDNEAPLRRDPGGASAVATGRVELPTFRFSVERSTN